MNILAIDPGQHTGLAFYMDDKIEATHAVRIVSQRGAQELRRLVQLAQRKGIERVVVESQYPRPGRAMQSLFGLAAYRGAVEQEARVLGMGVERVTPDEWKSGALRRLGISRRAQPEDKAKGIRELAEKIAGSLLAVGASDDVADAVVLGHWFLFRGLYV